MADLTDSQARILHVIRAFIGANGYPPTVREIAARAHVSSTSTIMSHLRSLQRRGVIRRDALRPRALVIIGDACPTCGNVPAGAPTTAIVAPTPAVVPVWDHEHLCDECFRTFGCDLRCDVGEERAGPNEVPVRVSRVYLSCAEHAHQPALAS